MHPILADLNNILSPIAVLFILPFLATRLTRYLNEKFDKVYEEEEKLCRLARRIEKSVYAVFHLSGEKWNIIPRKIEYDFKEYILSGCIPFYVREYVRSYA